MRTLAPPDDAREQHLIMSAERSERVDPAIANLDCEVSETIERTWTQRAFEFGRRRWQGADQPPQVRPTPVLLTPRRQLSEVARLDGAGHTHAASTAPYLS